jgi:hypothetical protein
MFDIGIGVGETDGAAEEITVHGDISTDMRRVDFDVELIIGEALGDAKFGGYFGHFSC